MSQQKGPILAAKIKARSGSVKTRSVEAENDRAAESVSNVRTYRGARVRGAGERVVSHRKTDRDRSINRASEQKK